MEGKVGCACAKLECVRDRLAYSIIVTAASRVIYREE